MSVPLDWDAIYAESDPARWETERPQPAFARLAEQGLLAGRVLDVGCGTGEHVLLAAAGGADALGVDISPRAIEQAQAKAAARGIPARFTVGDVLDLEQLSQTFTVIIDSGLFHNLADEGRVRYVTSLASALDSGGFCYLLCINEHQPGDPPPRKVTQAELRDSFREGWTFTSIVPAAFELTNSDSGTELVHAWLATIQRNLRIF
ncbi:MAG TPA: class I SAM-dependent methyltransferase [Streptosporangiaceae bacterium]